MNTIAEKTVTPSLDTRITDALASTEQLSSDYLGALYDELDIAVGVANQTARECRARSIDPLCRDAIAERGKAEDQEFVSTRLCNAATPLREKYQKALAREARERWQADTAGLKLRVADLSKELMDVYSRAVAELTALFLRAESASREVARFNSIAPPGCGLSGVDDAKRILERVRLPAPAGGSAPDSWPLPPAVPIGVMMHDMARSMMMGARPPTEDERAAEGERVIAHAQQMEHGRLRLNDELAARIRANDAEIRRLSNGELPR